MKRNTRIQSIMSPSLALATALSAANVSQAKAPARSPADTDPGLSRQSLANATYPIDGAPGGAVTLTNGKYDNPEARYKATLVGPRAVGDLNGDDELDAAVTLVVDSGGSGTFTYVCAVLNDNGQANPVDCTFIGDRIRMQRITIQNGRINVRYLDRKPSQPMSARPTVRKTLVFTLEGNQLVEQTSSGAAPAPGATAATLAGRYTAPNLPAADAAGRVIVLDLLAGSKAVMTTQFIGKGEPIVNEGTWKQDSDKAVVTLNSNQPQTLTFQLKGNQLVLLDPAQAGYGTEGLTLTRTPSGQTNSAEYSGVSLSFDADLAKSAQGATVPAVPVRECPALGGGSPEHIRFLFDGAKPPEYFDVRLPQVEVYSTESLRALDPSVAKTVDELQALLAKKPPPAELTGSGRFTHSNEIPVFPPIPAAQVFRVKPRYIDFKNGTGIGFVTYYTQGVWPVTKDGIFYTFQGLTTDGKSYVTAFWPVTTELLPATPEEALGGQSYEQWVQGYQGYDEYLTNLTKALDGLVPAAYTPDLLLIDGLVQSINVGRVVQTSTSSGSSLRRIAPCG